MRPKRAGFTLVELMIVVAIIGVLTAIGIANYSSSTRKSEEGVTKGNLGTLRSALGIYYTDNDGVYPTDNLSSITNNGHYLAAIPIIHTPPYHGDNTVIIAETVPSDTGQWSYDNASADSAWGAIHVGCLHQDMNANSWTSY